MTHRTWQEKGAYICPPLWSMSPASPHCFLPSRTAWQLGALSPAMCAAGKRARCTSHAPLGGAGNYNPICSTNCCSPECRIPLCLKNAMERAAEQAQTASQECCVWQTDLKTDLCNMLLVMSWALGLNGSLWGLGWSGGKSPLEATGPIPSQRCNFLSLHQKRSKVTAVIQANEVTREDRCKGRTGYRLSCPSCCSSRSEAGFLLPCCDSISVPASVACTAEQSPYGLCKSFSFMAV